MSRRPGIGYVAPVRERGLKSTYSAKDVIIGGRSRKGAWIEMAELGTHSD